MLIRDDRTPGAAGSLTPDVQTSQQDQDSTAALMAMLAEAHHTAALAGKVALSPDVPQHKQPCMQATESYGSY